jgi:hypothetical protein
MKRLQGIEEHFFDRKIKKKKMASINYKGEFSLDNFKKQSKADMMKRLARLRSRET